MIGCHKSAAAVHFEDEPPHHYVSKAYLGGFTDTGTAEGQLVVIDIETKRQWKGAPGKVARERDYNTVRVAGVDPLVFEEALGRVETMTMPIIRAMESSGAFPSPEDFNVLLNFTAAQFVRVPMRRQVMHGFLQQWAQLTLENITARPAAWERRVGSCSRNRLSPSSNSDADTDAPACRTWVKPRL